MKTIKLLLTLFLIVGLGSCSGDDDGGNGTVEANRLVGEWKIQSLTIDGVSVPITDCEAQSRVIFTANGNLTSTDFFEDENEECVSEVTNETWEYRGSNIYRFNDGSVSYEVSIIFSNNNNQFTVTEEDESGTYTITYTRV